MANRVLCIEIGNRMTHVVETDFKVKEPKIYKSFSFQTPDNLFKEETLADVLPFKERLDAGLEEDKKGSVCISIQQDRQQGCCHSACKREPYPDIVVCKLCGVFSGRP